MTNTVNPIVQKDIDDAVQAIVNQGGQSYNTEEEFCSYSYRCRRCVVGWMLTDPQKAEDYSAKVGGIDVFGLLESKKFQSIFPSWAEENQILLLNLQKFHDAFAEESRRYRLKKLNDLGLDTSAPQYTQWIEMALQPR